MEIWRPVKDYSDTYMVSNLGGVARLLKGSPSDGGKGYLIASLSRNGDSRTVLLHNLVCQAFHGDRPDGYVTNHKDGNKQNNRSDNLEWVTRSEDAMHAFANNLRVARRGSQVGWSKLTEGQVIEICSSSEPVIALSRKYGVGKSTISSIQLGRRWKHVDCPRRGIRRKLSDQDVLYIRAWRGVISQRKLARMFNVSQHLIKEVQLFEIYKSVGA